MDKNQETNQLTPNKPCINNIRIDVKLDLDGVTQRYANNFLWVNDILPELLQMQLTRLLKEVRRTLIDKLQTEGKI